MMFMIIAIIILLCYINGIELVMKRIHIANPYEAKRGLSQNNDDNYIALKRKVEGLYSIEISLGSHMQLFNVIFDTGSSIFWVIDISCTNCLSSNLYKSTESNTFGKTDERMSLNYLTGGMSGYISNDQLKLGAYSSINNVAFLLGDEITASIEIDGLLGLYRYYDSNTIKFSIINSLYTNGIIESQSFTVDCTKTEPKLFIGEKPSYLDQDKEKARCLCDNEVKYWNCKSSVQIGELIYKEEIVLLFDTGTNGIVIPKDMLNNVKENLFPINAFEEKCHISSTVFISISCTREFIDNDLMKNNITFILNNSHLVVDIRKLFNDDNDFMIYFGSIPQGGWLLGQPFFDQYATSFNYDDNSVTVYLNSHRDNILTDDNNKKGIRDNDITNGNIMKRSWTNLILNIVLCLFGIVLLIGMFLITYIWFKRKRIPMEMISYETPLMKNDF